MKRRRFRILVGIVIVGVVGTIAWRARRASGPVYEGESLAVWARRLPGGENDHTGIFWHPLFSQGIAGETKAEQAIRAMGTNTLPFLLRTMHTKDSTLSVRFNRLMWWARSRFSRQRIDYSSTLSAVQRRRWDAALALHALGPLAKSAVPELATLSTNDIYSRDAAYALAGIGPEGWGPLQQAMTNSSVWVRGCAIWAVGQTPTNGQFAVSDLLDRLHDKTYLVSLGAAWSLRQIHGDPELVAPALATNLGDMDAGVRAVSEGALKEYGITNVTTAALMRYLDDPKVHIRMAATNALRAIDPEAATKAGVR